MTIMGAEFFLEALCLRAYDNSEHTQVLIENVIEIFHKDVSDNTILDTPTNRLYIKVLEELAAEDVDLNNEGEKTILLMKFQHHPAVIEEPKILEQLSKILGSNTNVSEKRIKQLQTKLSNATIWYNSNKHLRKMFAKNQQCAITGDNTTQDILLNDVLEHARDLVKAYESNTGSVKSESIEEINLTKVTDVKNAIDTFKCQKETNIMKTGWQGLNRMLGESGGITMGEFVLFGALSHNYKTGILIDIARWMATLNKPDPTIPGIPTILVYTLENEAHVNLMTWMKSSYTNAYQKSPEGLTDDEIVDYVVKTYSKNGFTLIIRRKLGEFFGYHEWIAEIEELKAKGYKIYSCIIDYLTLMKIDEQASRPVALQKLAHDTKNYAKHEGFSLISAAQLDTNASSIATGGMTYVARKFGMTHIADCKKLFAEADVVIWLHKETNQSKVPYLTMAWGKHRDQQPPEKENQYCCYKFGKFGIMNDVNGEDKSVADLYADNNSEDSNKKVSLF